MALTDNMGFAVPELPSGRESFSPDVAYYGGPFSVDDMRFIRGAPTFAVEVRSEGDYGAAAEKAMAAKRTEYFAAGTPVVWDVDPIAGCVHVYRSDAPDQTHDVPQGPGGRCRTGRAGLADRRGPDFSLTTTPLWS